MKENLSQKHFYFFLNLTIRNLKVSNQYLLYNEHTSLEEASELCFVQTPFVVIVRPDFEDFLELS